MELKEHERAHDRLMGILTGQSKLLEVVLLQQVGRVIDPNSVVDTLIARIEHHIRHAQFEHTPLASSPDRHASVRESTLEYLSTFREQLLGRLEGPASTNETH